MIMDGAIPGLHELILNAPPLVAFAGYLIFQSKNQQKRLDTLHDNWINQINQLEDKSQTREDKLRARYDEIILKIEKSRDEQTNKYTDVVENMASKVQEMGSQLAQLAIETRKINSRISTMENDIVNLKLKKNR
tara:strand:- start:1499 stop:1900 length:402 start_codon:yes stop_codon:yes gene_type:complete